MNARDSIWLPHHRVRTIVAAVTRSIAYGTLWDDQAKWTHSGEHWRYELDQRTALAQAIARNHWATRSDDHRDYSVIRLGMIVGARARVENDLLIETLETKT